MAMLIYDGLELIPRRSVAALISFCHLRLGPGEGIERFGGIHDQCFIRNKINYINSDEPTFQVQHTIEGFYSVPL